MRNSKLNLICMLVVGLFSPEINAETEFKKALLTFSNGVVLEVEVADTIGTRQKGLMERMKLGENKGMLFVFEKEKTLSFWMRDTYLPLSIGFFSKSRKLESIQKMEPQIMGAKKQNLKSYSSEKPGLFALEVNQGWFTKNKIVKGITFKRTGLRSKKKQTRQ